eukprot:SAG22_NODE_329_length_12249_cov_27.341646_6_plen_56_part_00
MMSPDFIWFHPGAVSVPTYGSNEITGSKNNSQDKVREEEKGLSMNTQFRKSGRES